jgi:hypothetical protein
MNTHPMHRSIRQFLSAICAAAAATLFSSAVAAQAPPPRSESQPFRPAISPLPTNVNLESGTGNITAPPTAAPTSSPPPVATAPPSSQPPTAAAPINTPTQVPSSAPPGSAPSAPPPASFSSPPASSPTASTNTVSLTANPLPGEPAPTAQPQAFPTTQQPVPTAQQPFPQQPPSATSPPPSSPGSRSTSLTDQTANAAWQQSNPAPPPANGNLAQPAPRAITPAEITKVSQTFSSLPNDAGQVWREYDITPYTSQVRDNPNPEQAIVDWILRQTGTELWFRRPFGLMSATKDKLFVYHTPEIHNEIRPLVDRFVFSKAQTVGIDVRLCTIANPNWREAAYPVMQSVPVQSPGVEAWLISKENAAILLSNLSRRSDFRSNAGGRVAAQDGQPFVFEQRAPRQFTQSLQWTPGQGAGYQTLINQLNEGYRLKLSSLSSVDGRTVDLMLEGSIDQIEKFSNVRVPLATSAGTQSIALQVPQLVSWRLTERFRWPADQVLLVSCGVVAAPEAMTTATAQPLFGQSLGGLLDTTRKRADALLFIDYRGPQATPPLAPQTTQNNLVPIR